MDISKKTLKKHLNVIEETYSDNSRPWKESEINAIKNVFNRGIDFNNDSTPNILELYNAFNTMFEEIGDLEISEERSVKGLEYLKKNTFTKNGDVRNTKNFPFGSREVEILRDFTHFSFRGFTDICHGYARVFVPVYAVHSHGEYFEYLGVTFDKTIVVG